MGGEGGGVDVVGGGLGGEGVTTTGVEGGGGVFVEVGETGGSGGLSAVAPTMKIAATTTIVRVKTPPTSALRIVGRPSRNHSTIAMMLPMIVAMVAALASSMGGPDLYGRWGVYIGVVYLGRSTR